MVPEKVLDKVWHWFFESSKHAVVKMGNTYYKHATLMNLV
jgi:hypothetical protein